VAPLLDGVPSASWQQLIDGATKDDPWLWAHIVNGKSYNIQAKAVQAAKVGAVVFRLRVQAAGTQYLQQIYADNGLLVDPGIKRFFNEVDDWFDLVARWIRSTTDQCVEEDLDSSKVSTPGSGLTMLAHSREMTSRQITPSFINIVIASPVQAINRQQWRRILEAAYQKREPPVAYGLLAGARAAIHTHEFRRAVIDAGTAAELAIAALFRANYGQLSQRAKNRLDGVDRNYATLGTLVGWIYKVGEFPAAVTDFSHRWPVFTDVDAKLIKLRNAVVHDNKVPQYPEAKGALTIANQMVGDLCTVTL
jgi:hypothetical protein